MLDKLSEALNHDFCPWLNRYVYWLKRPIGWVILALLSSGLLGLYVSPQAFLATGGIALVGTIGSLWPWISMLGIRSQMTWSALRCEELDSIETSLTITNRWPWPIYGLSLELDVGLLPEGWKHQRISLQRIPGLAKSTFHWSTVPQKRGEYPREDMLLRTAFPFGIWTSSQPVHVPSLLIVWPRCTRLVDSPIDRTNQQFGTGSLSDRVGDEGDWTGVRPYRPGDTLRQVHWAQTARRDSIVVFERQACASQSVLIRMDVSMARCASDTTLDAMLRVFVSAVQQFQLHHWSVYIDLDARHETTGIAERLHQSQRVSFLDRMATWNPHLPDQIRKHTTLAVQKINPNLVLTISWNQAETILSHIEGSNDERRGYRFSIKPGPEFDATWDDQLRAAWQCFCRNQIGLASINTDRHEAIVHASGRRSHAL